MFLAVAVIAAAAGAATPIGTIPIGNTPYGFAADVTGTQAVVVNLFPVKNADGTDGPNVRVLDLAGQRELRAFKIGTRLVSVSLAGTSALVVNEDQDAVRILDINAGAQTGQITVGNRPSSVVALSTTTALVTNGTSGDVMLLDIPGRRVASTLAVGKDPRVAALHPGGRYVYVALGGEGAVVVVDLQGTPNIVGRVTVGKNPVALAFSVDGARAAVINLSSNTVSVLDTSVPTAPALVANVPAGAQPTGVAFGVLAPTLVYVSNQAGDYVTVLDIARDKSQMVQGVIDLGTSSSGIAVSNGGTRLYIAEFKNNANLRIYDLANLGPLSAAPAFELPGEPLAKTHLTALGDCATDFYIAEATLAPGATEGYWGMEVALSQEPRELTGGFNLGGGFDGGGRNPGFGAFYVPRAERVTFTIDAQPLAGPIALDIQLTKDNQVIGGVSGTPGPGAPLSFAADLTAGFHVVKINSSPTSGRGTFQLALATPGSFAGGVVVGGFIGRDSKGGSLAGFGAFCVPRSQSVTLKLFGRTEYPDGGVGDLVLRLMNYKRETILVADSGTSGGELAAPPAAPPVPGSIRWYVDAKSAGGNGTSASPLRSITSAVNQAQAGDVIFVRKGVYSPSATGEVLPIGSGGAGLTALRPNVQLVGEGADGTIIDGENSSGNLVVIPAAGVRFAGFTVKRAGAVGVYVYRSANVIVENVYATGNTRFGIAGEGSSGLIVRNNVAVTNLETGIAFVGSVPAAAPPGAPTNCPPSPAGAYGGWIVNNITNDNRADGILTGGGGNFCVADNLAVNNGSSGIEFNNRTESGPVPPLNGVVVNNTLTRNGAQQFAFAGTGILAAENGGTIDIIEGNKLSRNRPYGIGVFLDAKAGRITNNTVADSSNSGILVAVRATTAEISNNVVTGSGVGGIFIDNHSSVASTIGNRVTGSNRGLSVLDGSNLGSSLSDTFDDNATVGVDVGFNSQVGLLMGLSARNNGAGAPQGGAGFQVRDGSTVGELRAATISGNSSEGGIFVSSGSQLTVKNSTLEGNLYQGVFAFGAGTVVNLVTSSILNTLRNAVGQGGYGVNAQEGATIACSGVPFAGNPGGNVFTASGGSAPGCN